MAVRWSRGAVAGLAWALVAGGCGGVSPGGDDRSALDAPVADPAPVDGAGEADVPGIPDLLEGASDDSPDAPPTYPVRLDPACEGDADCASPCGPAVCREGRCVVQAAPGVCVDVSSSAITCWRDGQFPDAGSCLHCDPRVRNDGLTPVVLSQGFEIPGEGPVPVVTDLAQGGLSWSISERRAHTGARSLYFGDPKTGTYAREHRVAAEARFAGVALPAGPGAWLAFSLFLDTEGTPGFDRLVVRAVEGTETRDLWSSDAFGGRTGGRFVPVGVDLSALAGRTFDLAFVFDSVDGGINAGEGVYLDDVSLAAGCCQAPGDCDDGDPCTVDACGGAGGCSHERQEGCCAVDAECPGTDPCHPGACAPDTRTCGLGKRPECCAADADCDDGDPCTLDACGLDSVCTHGNGCCATLADCPASLDPCRLVSCLDGRCTWRTTCCVADSQCDDGDLCTLDRCLDGQCRHRPAPMPGCCAPVLAVSEFDSGLDGWEPVPGTGGMEWSVRTGSRSHTSPGALYFGDPETGMLAISGSAEVLSAPVVLPADSGLSLAFWAWIDLGYGWMSSFDVALVGEDGKEHTVWSQGYSTPERSWTQVSADVSAFGGRTVRVKLSAVVEEDPWIDWLVLPAASGSEGIFVDSFSLRSDCRPKACKAGSDCPSADGCLEGSCIDGICSWANACCAADPDCDDGNPCTQDACDWGRCEFARKAGCCVGPLDCDDGDTCTADACPGAGEQCLFTPIEDCCHGPKDCDDQDGCTWDRCVESACSHVNTCCASDAECGDGETTCTVDQCLDQHCRHLPTGAPGCCVPEVLVASFDDGSDGFTVDALVKGVGWRLVTGKRSSDGASALYYGNPATLNYNNGSINGGTATSPVVTVPAGFDATLSFDVYMDTETSVGMDRLWVTWRDPEGEWKVWDKAQLEGQKAFFHQVVPMGAFAGRTGQVRFHFDTVDSTVNGTEGVYLDAVRLESACAARDCTAVDECDDGIASSLDECAGGTCRWTLGAPPECEWDFECDDHDDCTYDSCEGGKCLYEEDPWCGEWWGMAPVPARPPYCGQAFPRLW